jgi:hypothetical protein
LEEKNLFFSVLRRNSKKDLNYSMETMNGYLFELERRINRFISCSFLYSSSYLLLLFLELIICEADEFELCEIMLNSLNYTFIYKELNKF